MYLKKWVTSDVHIHIASMIAFHFCILYYTHRMFLFSNVIRWTYHILRWVPQSPWRKYLEQSSLFPVCLVALMIFFFSQAYYSEPTFRNSCTTKCWWSINSRWRRGWIWHFNPYDHRYCMHKILAIRHMITIVFAFLRLRKP